MKALAKVNLYLRIVGKRTDGYHLLDSIFVFVNGISDEILINSSDKISLKIKGVFSKVLENEPNNLVLRAANLLKKHIR